MIHKVMTDTSVWIDFFKGKSTRETLLLEKLMLENRVVLCPVIVQEVLQGVVSDKDYLHIRNLITGFDILVADPVHAATGAADIYRQIRKKGKTIRKSNDCLIAWYCIHYNCSILHTDRDFGVIQSFTELNVA